MTSSRSKIKGTGGERELKALLTQLCNRRFRKTGAGEPWDLEAPGTNEEEPIQILATRPDRGRWLLTMTPWDYTKSWATTEIRVEVKRWAKFWHHSEYEETFK